jgi:fatty-acyl-CoA synthase
MELNIAQIFHSIADAYPERDCLVTPDQTFSWAMTQTRIRQFASILHAAGCGAHGEFDADRGWVSIHDHVALYLYNGPEYLEAMVGSYSARACPININYRYKAEELHYVLEDSHAVALVIGNSFVDTFAAVRDSLPPFRVILQVDDGSEAALLDGAQWYEEALSTAPSAPTEAEPQLSGDDFYACYTGGTTGMPKGVLWRQADFVVAALGVRQRDGSDIESVDQLVTAAERTRLRAFPAAPLMHGAAHWNALSCWLAGGTVVLGSQPRHLDPRDVWATVERSGATSLLIVGDSFARPLLDELSAAETAGRPYQLGSLRHILSGGAVLGPHSQQRFLEAIPGITIVDVLGSTESGRQGVATIRTGTGGTSKFAPSATAIVLDEQRHNALSPDSSETGWLAQSGRVPMGYLGDPERTQATFPVMNGVRYAVAGDRARWENGKIELLGRESVCINTGGEKVFAEEVETALKSHPAVTDAVVCGRASSRWGQEVVAVVSLSDPSCLDSELIAVCKEHLADFKAPKAIIRVERVERSPSGKADYAWATKIATQQP